MGFNETMKALSAPERREILNICKETGCELKQLPGIYQLLDGTVTLGGEIFYGYGTNWHGAFSVAQGNATENRLSKFFQVLKDEGAHIRFVFMTGITKFSQMSIFSELNNLKNISMMPEYSGLCGITKTELETTLRPHVADLAERMGCTTEEAYAKIKEYYDGYHFCEESEDIYAPYSLLNALNDGKVKEFWFESGTSSSLMENLKHYPLAKIMSYDGVTVMLKDFATSLAWVGDSSKKQVMLLKLVIH